MATERLRLEAEMRDNASPVIKRLRQELNALQESTREGRAVAKLNKEIETLRKESGGLRVTPGMTELPKWLSKTTTGAQDFVKTGGGVAGVIGAMGIGGLTAAASLSGLTALLKEMGDRALDMKELGRETGMTVDQVNAFAHAGEHFGVSADAMKGAINHLAGQMPEFRRNYGAMFQELSRWPDLIKKLQGESTEDQIKEIFNFLGQAKLQNEPQLQKQILTSIFGSGDDMEKLFAQGAQGFLSELEKQKRQLGPISPEMLKQAQAFRDSQIAFNDALEKFETGIGPGFLKSMTAIVDEAKSFFDTMAKRSEHGSDKSADGKDHRTLGEHLGDAVGDADKLTGKIWDWFTSKPTWNKRTLGNHDENPLLHKSSYSGNAGLLHNASYGGDFMGGDALSSGVKAGVLAAFREMMATQDLGKGGGGSGLIQASYESGGGGSRGGGGMGAGGHASPRLRGAGPNIENVDDYLDQKTIKGLSDGQTRNYEDILGKRESGNRYGIRNGYGFSGRWQFGAAALQENGYLRAGVRLRGNGAMNDPNMWTGKGGAHSLQDWLSNKDHVQDKAMLEYTSRHYDQLLRAGVPLDRMSPAERAGYLAAAHLKGVGGAISLYRGRSSVDANGTSTSSYFGMMRGVDHDRVARRADGLHPPHAAPKTPSGANHHLDVHIHDKGGNVTSASFRPGSDGGAIRQLTRWPTMRDANI